MTESKKLNDILLAMSEYHTGSERDAKEAIAAIYDAGMMIVDQTRAQPKYKRVDLDILKRIHPIRDRANGVYSSGSYEVDGYNKAIDDIKSKYGDLYTMEGTEK